jgi:ubiquinone/menaquinone biosynthesis C-methylase UbiE
MTIREFLLASSSFVFEKNIFFQKDLRKDTFEKKYIDLRKREDRVYSDDVLLKLPDFDGSDPLKKEWTIRKITLNKLISYFNKRHHKQLIIELGCGNGWLAHQLASSVNAEVIALDKNETELLQGARLFSGSQNLSFVYADIFTADIKKGSFDIILLASSVQYFSHLQQLIEKLLPLLNPSGEIHIVDSPIYKSLTHSLEAQKRSRNYFNAQGVPEMANNYFHHKLAELKNFKQEILFNPNSLISMFKRKLLRIPQSSFPWIMIKHP